MKLATLCYIKHNNQTLMIHRVKKENDFHEGKWNGLGGKFFPGESPEDCAIREVYEESGLLITNPHLKGFITFPAFDDIEDWYCFVFTATEFTGSLIDSPEGNLSWIKDQDLLNLNLWEGDYIFLPWLDQNTFFSAKFTYAHKALVSHSVIFYS